MGKKSKRNRKIAKKIDKWTTDNEWSPDEVFLAGIGALTAAAAEGKKKRFTKFVKRGRKYADLDVRILSDGDVDEGLAEASEPTIAYAPLGGGWYSVEVDGIEVDRVQGEERAAERAGSLLSEFAALEPDVQAARATSLTHAGGGWYEVMVGGVPVARIRGKDNAYEQYGHLVSSAH